MASNIPFEGSDFSSVQRRADFANLNDPKVDRVSPEKTIEVNSSFLANNLVIDPNAGNKLAEIFGGNVSDRAYKDISISAPQFENVVNNLNRLRVDFSDYEDSMFSDGLVFGKNEATSYDYFAKGVKPSDINEAYDARVIDDEFDNDAQA